MPSPQPRSSYSTFASQSGEKTSVHILSHFFPPRSRQTLNLNSTAFRCRLTSARPWLIDVRPTTPI